jgi:hypothetical protein
MAKQKGLFKFTGKLDNVIGYWRNGTYCLRSMPDTVRQTAATREASRNFGMASRRGKLVRRAFTGQLDVRTDGTLVNRLNKTLVQSGLQGMKGFRFNRHTGIDKFFHNSPILSEEGILRIPAQELTQLRDFNSLEVKAIAVRVDFAERRITAARSVVTKIEMDKPFTGAELNIDLSGKGTLIVTLQVRACKDSQATGDRRYMAADVMDVSAFPVQRAARKYKKLTTKNVMRAGVTQKHRRLALEDWLSCREASIPSNRSIHKPFVLQRE